MAVRVLTPEEEAMHRARASSAGGRAASSLLSSGIWRLPSSFPAPSQPAGQGLAGTSQNPPPAGAASGRQLLHVLRATGILDSDAADARAAGWELAMSRVLISPPKDFAHAGTSTAIEDLLQQASRRLADLGTRIDVLRTRDGCAVLRSSTRPELLGAAQTCELSKGFLEAVPYLAGMGDAGVIVETSCQHRGARGCLYTLTWPQTSRVGSGASAGAGTAPGSARDAEEPAASMDTASMAATDRTLPDAWDTATSGIPGIPATFGIPGISGVRSATYHLSGTQGSLPSTDIFPGGGSLPSTDPRAAWNADTPPSTQANSMRSVDVQPWSETGDAGLEPEPEPEPQAPASPSGSTATQTLQTLPPAARRRRAGRHPWVFRRGWLILLATVVTAAGGYWAGKHATITYSAQALLDVRSGATQLGPGNAAEADSLAISDAAIIPTDTALLRVVASQLGVPTATVEHSLSVIVERNTSVIAVSYSAPTSQDAIAGATLLAQAISDGLSPTAAIPPGSIVPVQMPKQAARSGKLERYGLPLGAVLGLVLGIILVMAAERADPRADKASDLARAVPCPAAEVPGGVSLVELSRILSLSEGAGAGTGAEPGITVVPLDRRASDAATKLVSDVHDLAMTSMRPGPHLNTSATFDSEAGSRQAATGEGPTVLAVVQGERLKRAAAAAERLGLVGRAPVLAVLLPRASRGR